MFASQSCPEPIFRRFIYETAMKVQSRPEKDKESVNLTEDVHFIAAGEHPEYPDHALVKLAIKLKGGGDVYITTHFEQLKALVQETQPEDVLVEFVALLENGLGNKISAAKWKELVKPNPCGSELMANNNMFTSAFGGGSNGKSDVLPVEHTLPALWFGYHIPVVYRLCTGLLPPGGFTLVSDPALNAKRDQQRADAYEKLALFPNVEEWCAVVQEAFEQCAASAEVAVLVSAPSTLRADLCFWVYVKTRTTHKRTLKNLKKLAGIVKCLLRTPLDWAPFIPEPRESWITDENGVLRPWPVVASKAVPSTIYRTGVVNSQLTEFMIHAAGEELALALVNEERALALGDDQRAVALPQVQEAQLTVFDMVQRVKTAAVGTDGTLDALVSYVKGRQVAAGTASVEELEEELVVIDAKIADLSAQKVQSVQQAVELQDTNAAIKSQIRDFDNTNELLARMRKQKWANLSEKQRTDIIDAETQLDNSIAAKRQKASA
jgi:hypothetical protein